MILGYAANLSLLRGGAIAPLSALLPMKQDGLVCVPPWPDRSRRMTGRHCRSSGLQADQGLLALLFSSLRFAWQPCSICGNRSCPPLR
jgi:hypothetical protein